MTNMDNLLALYKANHVKARGICKKGQLYIGNLNDEDNLYYWSLASDLDSLAFITTDKYGKEVCCYE